MFEENDIKYFDFTKSKSVSRLILKNRNLMQFLDRYTILIIPIAFIVLGLMGMYFYWIQGEVTPYILIVGLMELFLGTILLFLIKKGIDLGQQFLKITTNKNKEINRKAMTASMQKSHWKIIKDTSDVLIATTPSGGFSWGKIIIIIYDSESVLICCDNRSGLFAKVPILSFIRKKIITNISKQFIHELKFYGP